MRQILHKPTGDTPFQRGLKYTDYIFCKEVDVHLDDFNMILNSLWWWGSSSEDGKNVESSFIAIIHKSTLTRSYSTNYSLIYVSNRSVLIKNL